jgi:AraC-like DNA-binding protein
VGRHFRIAQPFVRRLDQLGVSRAAVLEAAGLPPSLFAQEKVLVTTREFFALHAGIAAVSGDPTIGIKLGQDSGVERYDTIAIVALHAASLAEALPRVQRYKQLTCPEKIHLTTRGGETRIRFEWLLAEEPEPPTVTDLCFAWITAVARRGTADAVSPCRVELARPRAHAATLEKHFRCPVAFGARENVLAFTKADAERPFVTRDDEMTAVVAPHLEAELRQQLETESLRDQVKTTLKRTLAGQGPDLAAVARELKMSTRTLQRRLTGESATFQQLVAEARRELARHYLRHARLELNETAYLLGYKDANSFFRAFHQWEGTTPGEWRAAVDA